MTEKDWGYVVFASLALSAAAVRLARTRAVAGGLVPADLWAGLPGVTPGVTLTP